MSTITILNVIDNYFGSKLPDFRSMPEAEIEEFGKLVREFSSAYVPPSIQNEDVFPSYLGGWPSALWQQFSPLVMTSLLYSGQVLVKDPILDWFSDEQYELPHLIDTGSIVLFRNASGYEPRNTTPEVRLNRNRYFLHKSIPALLESRALIENGILVLAPSKKFELSIQKKAEELATTLIPSTMPNVAEFTKQFRPIDLPRSDETRGLFLIMQSKDKRVIEKQIDWNVREALYYYSVEYLLAQQYGFTYTSTFAFEEYVCKNAMTPSIKSMLPGQHIYQGLLNSKFPLYQGLTPSIIAEIRDDEHYREFRRELYELYSTLPVDVSNSELRRHIREAEESLLRPVIDKLE